MIAKEKAQIPFPKVALVKDLRALPSGRQLAIVKGFLH